MVTESQAFLDCWQPVSFFSLSLSLSLVKSPPAWCTHGRRNAVQLWKLNIRRTAKHRCRYPILWGHGDSDYWAGPLGGPSVRSLVSLFSVSVFELPGCMLEACCCTADHLSRASTMLLRSSRDHDRSGQEARLMMLPTLPRRPTNTQAHRQCGVTVGVQAGWVATVMPTLSLLQPGSCKTTPAVLFTGQGF